MDHPHYLSGQGQPGKEQRGRVHTPNFGTDDLRHSTPVLLGRLKAGAPRRWVTWALGLVRGLVGEGIWKY